MIHASSSGPGRPGVPCGCASCAFAVRRPAGADPGLAEDQFGALVGVVGVDRHVGGAGGEHWRGSPRRDRRCRRARGCRPGRRRRCRLGQPGAQRVDLGEQRPVVQHGALVVQGGLVRVVAGGGVRMSSRVRREQPARPRTGRGGLRSLAEGGGGIRLRGVRRLSHDRGRQTSNRGHATASTAIVGAKQARILKPPGRVRARYTVTWSGNCPLVPTDRHIVRSSQAAPEQRSLPRVHLPCPARTDLQWAASQAVTIPKTPLPSTKDSMINTGTQQLPPK